VFRGHHLSAGTICRKLVEFLQLRQENRSVYDYTQEFNNLTQYGVGITWIVMLRRLSSTSKGLNILLQDRLMQNLNLSYNDLISTAINQEGTMRTCEAAEQKEEEEDIARTHQR
jgi:hypothetical protein